MKPAIIRLLACLAIVGVTALSVSMGQSSGESKNMDPAMSKPEHTEWVAILLRDMEAIKPGMAREDLLKVFRVEGGLSTREQRTYVCRKCPYIKVDVTFEAVGTLDDKLREYAKDKITTISKPFLEWSIAD